MGPKKGVTVTEALTRNLAPLLEMKANQDGIPTELLPENILSFLHEIEQYQGEHRVGPQGYLNGSYSNRGIGAVRVRATHADRDLIF